ncbi:hypothetical protein LEV95_002705 [Salmonella enterica]|nr:hypothetical protein [Salmonella enterica]
MMKKLLILIVSVFFSTQVLAESNVEYQQRVKKYNELKGVAEYVWRASHQYYLYVSDIATNGTGKQRQAFLEGLNKITAKADSLGTGLDPVFGECVKMAYDVKNYWFDATSRHDSSFIPTFNNKDFEDEKVACGIQIQNPPQQNKDDDTAVVPVWNMSN